MRRWGSGVITIATALAAGCAAREGTGSETHFQCTTDESCIASGRGNRCIDHVCKRVASSESSPDSSPMTDPPGRLDASVVDTTPPDGGASRPDGGHGSVSEGGTIAPPPPVRDSGGDAACTDTLSDNFNCGRCGHACGELEVCADGECMVCQNCGDRSPIIIDATNAYWLRHDVGSHSTNVMTAALMGGTTTKILIGFDRYDFAMKRGLLYYVYETTLEMTPVGGGAPTTLSHGIEAAASLSADETTAYIATWPLDSPARDGRVLEVPLAGGDPTTLFSGLKGPGGLVVDANSAYVIDVIPTPDPLRLDGGEFVAQGKILKIPFTGGQPTTLATAPMNSSSPVVDATRVYWTGGYAVMSVPKAGGEIITLAANRGRGPHRGSFDVILDTELSAVVVDETTAYWAVNDDPYARTTRVMKVAKSGGTPVLVADNQRWIGALALDGANLYWIDPVRQTVVRHAK